MEPKKKKTTKSYLFLNPHLIHLNMNKNITFLENEPRAKNLSFYYLKIIITTNILCDFITVVFIVMVALYETVKSILIHLVAPVKKKYSLNTYKKCYLTVY